MPRPYRIGQRVRVVEGSGLMSGKTGTVISMDSIPTNYRNIPQLDGYYKPVDWREEVAIRYDDGSLGTMYTDRLWRSL